MLAIKKDDCVGARGMGGLSTSALRIAKDAVAKPYQNRHEGYMMQFVTVHTNIRVPTVRRILRCYNDRYIVMDYIEGETLQTLWPKASFWQKCRIVWTLRGYVRQLRKVKLPYPTLPGPFDETGEPAWCMGFWFGEPGAGPFPTMDDMKAFFQEKLLITLALDTHDKREVTPRDKTLQFESPVPLVLTHGDLSPYNIMVDKKGNVVLLDWGFSGAYPIWFEHVALMAYQFNPYLPRSWYKIMPLYTGWFPSHAYFHERIQMALLYYHMTLEGTLTN
jgi:aminoglycoside phosphotransferase (APT) family kinase protein